MKVYITKYALTQGIIIAEGDQIDNFPNMIKIREDGFMSPSLYHKGEWFSVYEAAVENANKRRTAKIKSLEKQLATIRKLKF